MSRSWAHKFLCHYDLTAMSRSWAHKFLCHYDFTVMSRSWAHKFLCHYDVTVMSPSWAHNSDVTMSSQWCHPHDITSMTCVWPHCELTWHHFTTGLTYFSRIQKSPLYPCGSSPWVRFELKDPRIIQVCIILKYHLDDTIKHKTLVYIVVHQSRDL